MTIKESEKKEYVRWAYRLFLDREPENEAVLERNFSSAAELRNEFMQSDEYLLNNLELHSISKELWVLHESCYGFKIYINLNENAICWPILYDSYEVEETKLIQSLVHSGDCVLDIGANVGYYSLLMANIVGDGGQVISFEPIPFLSEHFEKSIAENNYNNIKLHKAALSNKEGSFEMIYLPNAKNAGGSFLNTLHEKLQGHNTIDVKTMMLDRLNFEKQVTFLKMDVEGAENLVLEGGQSFFKENRPSVLTEIHPSQLQRVSGISATDYIKKWCALGYHCYAVPNYKRKIVDWDNKTIGNLFCKHDKES
ncbi:MAG: FkbM family methyltransferase [Peptococcaceae bacterium]|nr:FkbM family methyltransferase [Peptococcaceae bacterium]